MGTFCPKLGGKFLIDNEYFHLKCKRKDFLVERFLAAMEK